MYEILLRKEVTRMVSGEKEYKKISDTGGKDGEGEYGYVIRPDYEKTEWIEVLKQRSEECNVLDVVAAFNGVTFK